MKRSYLLLLLLLGACAGPRPADPPLRPTAQTQAPSATPPAQAAAPRRPPIGTFFFYWYDCPERECDAQQLSVVPPGWLTPLPRDPDARDGRAYSSQNGDWYEAELRDMAAAGIDVLFPVSWGDHPHNWFRHETLGLLVQANAVRDRPLPIGMFLDTTAQQAMYRDFQGEAYRFGPDVPRLPLSDPLSGYFFYDLHIKGFFEQIPREMWATVQGRPIIISYTALCCDDRQLSGALWGAVKAAFERDFGVEPWLILEDTWFGPEALSPPAERPSVAQVADGRYSWGTALNGPASHTVGDYTVSSVGPGFDNRRITGISNPQLRPRDGGAFLRSSLAAVPPDSDLLLIETWNEWPESTGIARAAHQAADGQPLPEDFYMQIVREWKGG
jgi:Domain of unknown function (DUF5010)